MISKFFFKKVTIFGLDARKMSVKKIALNVLFLANLRRLSFRLVGGDSYSYKSQMAAMFGLDARIALAIFGALSIITGAALYSAIEKSKTVAIITDLNEIGKAFEAYYLDTGKPMQRATTCATHANDCHIFNPNNLITQPTGVSNWAGPYFKYKIDSASYHSFGYKYGSGSFYLMSLESEDGKLGTNDWNAFLCTSGKNCALWIVLGYVLNPSQIKQIDKLVDSGDGQTKGKIRWHVYSGHPETPQLHFKYMPLTNIY